MCLSIAANEAPLEYQLKAAFLLNFTKFIEWPPSAFESPDAPFRICISEPDPFGDALNKMIAEEKIGAHGLTVDHWTPQASLRCQVIFFPKSQKNVGAALEHLPEGVLTVGENENFLREGGVIRFVIENNHVRFDVNQTAARKMGLTISSKLLNIARAVEEKSK